MFRPRGFAGILVAACLLLGNRGLCAREEDIDDDYTYNEIDLVKTYRTGVEKLLQGLMRVVTPAGSNERSGGITKFVTNHLPKPIKTIITGAKDATNRGFGDVLNLFEDNFHAIFPGTRWCGGGNIASNEEDVGVFKRTDACCREHDNCPANIDAGRSRENLLNNGAFTRSACFCDEQFHRCLKNVSSVISTNIGMTYFNILRPQCFSYDYPIKSCAKHDSTRLVHKKCLKYNLDETRNKTLAWFDSPDF